MLNGATLSLHPKLFLPRVRDLVQDGLDIRKLEELVHLSAVVYGIFHTWIPLAAIYETFRKGEHHLQAFVPQSHKREVGNTI